MNTINGHEFDLHEPDGKRNQEFNHKLRGQFHKLVFEIDKNDIQTQKELLEKRHSVSAKILLFIPACIGFFIHAPLYLPIKNFSYKKTWNNDHYDSVLVALLLFIYPFYLVFLIVLAVFLTHNLYFLILIFVLPFTAWSYAQLKPELDKPGAISSST